MENTSDVRSVVNTAATITMEIVKSEHSTTPSSQTIRPTTRDNEKSEEIEKPSSQRSKLMNKAVLDNALVKTSQSRSSHGVFLSAYAAMFGNRLKNSRRSGARSSLSSIMTAGQSLPRAIELPTYRLEPLQKEMARWSRVKILLDSMITDFADRGQYDKLTVNTSIRNISQNLLNLSKELGFSKRYRYVAVVEIGENNGQGYHSTSRCLWNTEFDGCISSSVKTSQLFIVASLFIIYID